jgi:hypothetical protein
MTNFINPFCRLGALALALAACNVRSSAPLVINEVLPSNQSFCTDQAGEHDDWVEIYNKSANAMDLQNYSLTDDTASPRKSVLPAGIAIEGGATLLLWADGAPEQGADHLSFKLKAQGEEIVLYDPDQKEVDLFRWADAVGDVSFARVPDGTGDFVRCAKPTCGRLNGSSCSP